MNQLQATVSLGNSLLYPDQLNGTSAAAAGGRRSLQLSADSLNGFSIATSISNSIFMTVGNPNGLALTDPSTIQDILTYPTSDAFGFRRVAIGETVILLTLSLHFH